MQKAKRGIGSGRFVWIALLSTATLALTACGDDDSGAAATTSSTSSGTPATASDTASSAGSSSSSSGSSNSSGSSSSAGSSSAGSSSSSSSSTSSGSSGSTSSTGSSSITLGWTAPTQNSNGTPITNLAGYKIHYGTVSQDYTQVVSIANPSLSRYVIDSLPNGTYYFAITSYNAQGVESSLSGEVSATLNN